MTIMIVAGFYAALGPYAWNVLWRRGASVWVTIEPSDTRLSPSMRLALAGIPQEVTAGPMMWRALEPGFEVGELPVMTGALQVDSILLARIDPARFRFAVRTASAGDRELDDWMRELDAALVINGSYYGRDGQPDTPLIEAGVLRGPHEYRASHGAFVATAEYAELRDLKDQNWQEILRGADDGFVSYPLLLAADGSTRTAGETHWLANRSFVAQDANARIVLGTTTDAFFSLARLAEFLRAAPLELDMVLNLDGGPVACQAVRLRDFRRDFCGRWEMTDQSGEFSLLQPALGQRRWALPIVLAVFRRADSMAGGHRGAGGAVSLD